MIRDYKLADKETLLQLLRMNTPAFFAPDEEVDFVKYLGLHPHEHYVWEENQEVLGCAGCSWYPDSDDGRVAWFIVHQEAHGKGIGRGLLGHCLNRLRSNPATKKIIVRTSQLAEGFFASGGFQVAKREKDYWAPGFDLVYMTMTIS